ncbi:NlpC/P60 family protein [Streptomyces ipomoeae]|uniref:NlpC/P60 family protein n=2 Tax=Streptomyces ipomoeae TaxID=103232 RepID=L1L110_9ACTN|nr:C40 family peptidase [Streptomyces ipomoeae]EKX66489.1 NlpC/P60 family protein [Streptomyces ipomoeae 91-03]MDX2694905.1 C40 family peptidase [Streptomyces ipomoeae]MDX2822932.1 C40 family peptidase [Streptomyces ipomoeae]MDX2840335.1 C40 family peptidase [Streptomyces ipomoeae]MDX2875978.1 C40 family peptidase [Streptomyces ipomoeae]
MEEPLVPLVPMSHTAHIRSHRKPRRNGSSIAMRAGVAGGVLSTVAVAGASTSAFAAEPATQTLELPTLTADLATQAAQSADATQQMAADYQLQAERETAAEEAAKQAEKDLAKAKKEEARKKAAEEAERKAEAERASRTSERSTLSTNSTSTTTPPASGSVGTVIAFLKAQLGDAYVLGATGPNAWDCSSLVQAAFKQVGVDLPRVSQDQSMQGTDIPLSQIQPGDILYWGGKGSAYHVGVYLGGGQYLDAANPSKGVVIQDLSGYPASGAVRVL